MNYEGIQISHYQLLRLVGSGGMGEVYLAQDTKHTRRVAVKIVRSEVAPYPNVQVNQDVVRLFQREMKAVSALDHPNILQLYDFGEHTLNNNTTLIYMVMPFRPEGSLVDWLNRRNSTDLLPPRYTVHIMTQAAIALQHAHNHQIVHMDVKPANFLIWNRDERPQFPDLLLADFGVARFNTATATASQTVRGTPTYMPPEQWAGSPVPATDQYALAIMAYQLLTGTSPFLGSMQQVMFQHLQELPKPMNNLNTRVPATVDAVVLRALAKAPQDRFASIMEFATAFEQAWDVKKPISVLVSDSSLQPTQAPTISPNLPTPIPEVAIEPNVSLLHAEASPSTDISQTLSAPEQPIVQVPTPLPVVQTPPVKPAPAVTPTPVVRTPVSSSSRSSSSDNSGGGCLVMLVGFGLLYVAYSSHDPRNAWMYGVGIIALLVGLVWVNSK